MSGPNIGIINYGAGNLRSVAKALESLGANVLVTADPAEIAAADGLVLPGQGACDSAMVALEAAELTESVKQAIAGQKPFFGVCLGLQLLFDYTEEGGAECLGVIPGRVRRFPPGLKVPHMGWNTVELLQPDHPVFADVPQGSHFYFVHSYYPDPASPESTAAVSDYGLRFCCAVAEGNVVATQFHPEKSGPVGLRLYGNFLRMVQSMA
ncbi:MAG: imidazole glycerol phosphate synthase subunit HisH [Chloroflexota bacterium]|nr:imidazole glycerol phosphate synthase subunit HisH [Chloroflexota bacterium]MDE2970010.1 imidazole glycerol phosphate synthase subunit HisH [Chloroflexota bacterium]